MTPILAVSPLSPDRARHRRIRGTRTVRSDVNVLVSDNDMLLYGIARHERGPERNDFGRLRAPLVGDVSNSWNRSKHARHELRREPRIDLALLVVAYCELDEHFARLTCRQRRMACIPPDELVQRLVVRRFSAGGIPERFRHLVRFRQRLGPGDGEPAERAPTRMKTDRDLQLLWR